MDVAQAKLFVDPGWRRAWLLVIPVGLIWAYLWPWHLAALYTSALFICPLLVLFIIPGIEMGPDGMRLNRCHTIKWGDIAAVQYKPFLGLPYLKVRKTWGVMDWWFPLFVRRPTELRDAVREFSPTDSPMREAVERYYTQQTAAADASTATRLRRG